MKTFIHEGITYSISSFSGTGHSCVGVCIQSECVRVINTNSPEQKATFTLEEWAAFLLGMKQGQFDLKR